MITVQEGYARVLVQAAQECGRLAQVRNELGRICDSIMQNTAFFGNPVIPASKQEAALRGALEGKTEPLTLVFLCMLAKRRRLKKLPAIRRNFEQLADALLGRITITLRTPFAPDEALLIKLRHNLTAHGLIPREHIEDVTFKVILDRSLIGGFTAEQGGRVLDASVKSRLAALRGAAKGR